MAIEQINLGTVVQDGADGDVARVAFTKVNANFADLESRKVEKVAGKQLSTEDYTSAEKMKLGGIQAGAQVNTVTSVAGKTGAVALVKGDVGLGNVDNTSDANKPISTATQTALNLKANTSTQIIAGTGLTGGGTLATNRTLTVSYGTTAGTAAQGNDSRLSDAREWSAETVSQAEAEAGTGTTRRAWTAQRVAQAVRWTVLTGLSTTSDSVLSALGKLQAQITDSDSVLSALGKLQAQITDLVTSKLDATANAVSATKLATARTIALVGDVTGSASFDGSGNVSINAQVANDSHTHSLGNLGLGNAATATVQSYAADTTGGRLMAVGAFGLGGVTLPSLPNLDDRFTRPGFYACIVATGAPSPYGVVHIIGNVPGEPVSQWVHQVFYDTSGYVFERFSTNFSAWSLWRELYHTGNTTVDANGFVKRASPIIKLHADRIETDAVGTFERIGTGHYRIIGCNGLRLTDGWYIETPHDRNGNKYFNVEWEQDTEPNADAGVLEEAANVALTIRCYERVWNPTTGLHENCEPVDILAGRWIDLRMNEVRQSEPEQEVDE